MKKAGTDPKVKKTLLRNYEQKIRTDQKTVCAISEGPSKEKPRSKKELDHPTLCSSEALSNYLTDVRKYEAPPLSIEDLKINKSQISAKITKKLNFHFNDQIYKNLVELNTKVADVKGKKDKKVNRSSTNPLKKDQEPKIEDFCQDVNYEDMSPNIQVIKHKFKPVRNVENGQLHRLLASFERL